MFKIGTGWLGWTPEVTLNAALWEIELAYDGKLDLLKAVYGSGETGEEDDQPKNTLAATPGNVKRVFSSLKNKGRAIG